MEKYDESEVLDLDLDEEEEMDKKALKKKKRKENRPKRIRGHIIRIVAAIAIIFGLRQFVSYTTISKIAELRTLYIETAMSTNSHQWLATLFFPKDVIQAVLDAMQAQMDAQKSLKSEWETETETEDPEADAEEAFYEKYWELDSPTFRNYLKYHPELLENGYDNILIEDLEETLNIYTTQGDPILVVDTANNFMLVSISDEGDGVTNYYVGKMALVKDPAQVEHVLASSFGSSGERIASFAQRKDALIAINADPFLDPNGVGGGGTVLGSCILDGTEYGNVNSYMFYGMKTDNRFYITQYPSDISDYRWGLQFFPAMIVNGENVLTSGSGCMGLQPRTCIGQEKDGTFMMLIVDGRQPGYSIGTSVAVLADRMATYDCLQAANLDGGSSAVMYYNGVQITKSSSGSGLGRYCPDALIINKVSNMSE